LCKEQEGEVYWIEKNIMDFRVPIFVPFWLLAIIVAMENDGGYGNGILSLKYGQ